MQWVRVGVAWVGLAWEVGLGMGWIRSGWIGVGRGRGGWGWGGVWVWVGRDRRESGLGWVGIRG